MYFMCDIVHTCKQSKRQQPPAHRFPICSCSILRRRLFTATRDQVVEAESSDNDINESSVLHLNYTSDTRQAAHRGSKEL